MVEFTKKRKTFTDRVVDKIIELLRQSGDGQWSGIDYVDVEKFSNYVEISYRTHEGSMSKWEQLGLKNDF